MLDGAKPLGCVGVISMGSIWKVCGGGGLCACARRALPGTLSVPDGLFELVWIEGRWCGGNDGARLRAASRSGGRWSPFTTSSEERSCADTKARRAVLLGGFGTESFGWARCTSRVTAHVCVRLGGPECNAVEAPESRRTNGEGCRGTGRRMGLSDSADRWR